MMLRFIDGFDHHSNSSMSIYGKWTSNINFNFGADNTYRRFSGNGQYVLANGNNSTLSKNFGSNEASGVFGIAFRPDVNGGGNYTFYPFMLYDGSTMQMAVRSNSDRTLSIMRNSTVLATSTYQYATGIWTYLELKWKIADSISTADVILRADNVDIITLNSGDTKHTSNAYVTDVCLHSGNSFGGFGSQVYYDDFYWLDLTGSKNNAPLGPVRVSTLFPTGNGNSSQMTNQAGNSTNNYLYVDDNPPNGDTDYVETATTGNKDTYTYDSTPASTNTIYGVAINTSARKTDAGTRTFKNQMRISSTDYEGVDTALNTSYTTHQEIREDSPATSSAWTKSEVDATQFGTKCHS